MGKAAGGFLRTLATALYFLEFICAAVALGIFSYFLSKLSIHDLPIIQRWRAVEGIVGAAVLYTIFAVLLTCFLGGMRGFAWLAILLDIAFCGAMVAVAVLTRHGASSCSGVVNTPLGISNANVEVAGTRNGYACRLNTAVFAVSLIAAFLFLISAIIQVFVMRHHQKEKKYGPSPANNYTSGSGNRKFWQKKPKATKDVYSSNDTELGTTNGTHHNGTALGRPSHEAGHLAPNGNAPNGTVNGANPYGYNNTHPTGTAVNY